MNLGVIGKYRLIRSLGKGGMGEVFLAQDTICNRQVALKKIREDLLKHPSIKSRFLGEAHIAAQLTHPSIVPIFSIHTDEQLLFYTMPYVEGDTLKEVLRASKSENNVSALIRIFLSVCQAIAYCHSKQIIHRDIKPENIIVGKFGEVLLLDWGIADYLGGNSDEFAVDIPTAAHLTKPGKVVGTLTYLAPERAKGEWGSEQSDLYSLGVILYQILTLKLPFKRVDLATFKKNMNFEELIDPIEAAPYRDIPRKLAEITKKCLAFHKEERYSHVSELVAEIEAYHEGRAEWMVAKDLEINRKEDWEFQENILLTKHLALAHSSDLTEWVSLMISKLSFTGNTKVEAKIRIGKDCEGIGFLMNIQEVNNRKNLMDGYYLLIGSKKQPGFHLYLSNIEVMQAADCILVPDRWYHLKIEKSDTHLRVYLDHSLKCHYISHTPLGGAHVGLLYRDTDFEIEHFNISIGSQDALISCLAVPDAFLANKNYSKALNEYRRIAYSFPGRSEEREATFRAGISLLEHGLTVKNRKKRGMLFNAALDEFSKLRNSAGAPLEYLGKSLVYKSLGEVTEEVKCLELSIRKYVNHPLQPRIVEHLIFRLYETSHHNRLEAYHFSLLCLRQLPTIFYNMENQKLVDSLKKNWESRYFL
jgi:serine/threonine protein kinase